MAPANANAYSKACENCGKEFKARATYYLHRRGCEDEEAKAKRAKRLKYKCLEDGCEFAINYRPKFLLHLKDDHLIDVELETKKFPTYQAFENWKEHYEKATTSFFKTCFTQKNKIGPIKEFACNRSGEYKPLGSGKRKTKSHGPSKIGRKCPAYMKVQLDDKSPEVEATICGTHYGHSKQLAHIRIPKSERIKIAQQLAAGVKKEKILQQALPVKSSEKLQRQHILTRKDLRNIAKSFGIKIDEPKPLRRTKGERGPAKPRRKKAAAHPPSEVHASGLNQGAIQPTHNVANQPSFNVSHAHAAFHPSSCMYGTAFNQNHLQQTNQTPFGISNPAFHPASSVSAYIDRELTSAIRGAIDRENAAAAVDGREDLGGLKTDLMSRLLSLRELIQRCDNKDTLIAAAGHLASATSILETGLVSTMELLNSITS